MFYFRYSTLFTNFPVFSLVLDKDVSSEIAMTYPELYKELTKVSALILTPDSYLLSLKEAHRRIHFPKSFALFGMAFVTETEIEW